MTNRRWVVWYLRGMVEQRSTRRTWAGRFPAAVVAALLFGALLVGCGGGDDEDSGDDSAAVVTTSVPDSPTLDREQIIAEGDAICAEVNAAVGGLASTDASPAIQLGQRSDLYTGMVERLRALDSDDPGLTDVFSAGRDLVQAASEAEAAAMQGDTEATVAAETTVTASLAAFRAAASDYGFTECGGPPSTPVTQGDPGAAGSEDPAPSTGEQQVIEPEPQTTTPPAGGAAADGGNTGGAVDGGTDAGTDAGTGGGTGGDAGGNAGGDSSTGGFSPGG